MNAILAAPLLSTALTIALKASLILAAAAVVDGILRRRASAAARHLTWTAAVTALLLLPLLALVMPSWPIPVSVPPPVKAAAGTPDSPARIADSIAPADPVAAVAVAPANETPGAAPVPWTWPTMLLAVYIAGLIGMLGHAALERRGVRRLLREAVAVEDPAWIRELRACAAIMGVRRPVRLLRSRARCMPMAVGTRRSVIVIPATADAWPEDRRRAVLLHELAHVARLDCLTQTLAIVARAIHWFQPAAWWAARRLRIERELACDDRVLAAGAPAREYAGHLLDIAYAFGGDRAPAIAVSMARPAQLEDRILAALDAARNRRVPALRACIATGALGAALIAPLAALTATVAAPQAETAPAVEPPPASPATERAPARQVLDPVLKPTMEPLRAWARALVRTAAARFGLQEGKPGTWELRPSKDNAATVHLRLVELRSSSGTNVPIDRLEGLTAAQLKGPGGPVAFRLRRDAGTFTFEGVIRNGVGAGTFSFAPDPAFPEGLVKRGFARPTGAEQYQLARHDVGFAFVDELSKQGYAKPTTAELVRAGQHGVQTDYLREMGALGYRLGTLPPLIDLRDHGVTPAYVRQLADSGYKGLSADELRRARDHGVTPEYVTAMRQAGYTSLSMDQLVNARDHGVSADYVRGLAAAGHRDVPLDRLVRARDHGVSVDYVQEMRSLGYASTLDDLERARDHGVNPEFARELAALGYRGPPIDALVQLRDHGVTPGYVKELKSLGYEALSIDDLTKLRDHGLTADRIRAANERAGTRLSVDRLVSFASSGR